MMGAQPAGARACVAPRMSRRRLDEASRGPRARRAPRHHSRGV
ncbi:Hypothetical protein A7982_05522 [Minicystis rosea]|nr:Hypothetical protein A7982_05522 [Minicystis rosea]